MKMTRHAKIKEIIDNNKIETQEDLASALRHQGIDVTQATVSRDIKELMHFNPRSLAGATASKQITSLFI